MEPGAWRGAEEAPSGRAWLAGPWQDRQDPREAVGLTVADAADGPRCGLAAKVKGKGWRRGLKREAFGGVAAAGGAVLRYDSAGAGSISVRGPAMARPSLPPKFGATCAYYKGGSAPSAREGRRICTMLQDRRYALLTPEVLEP